MPPTRVCRYIVFLRLAIFIQRRFRPRKKKKCTRRSPRRDRLGYRDRVIVGRVDFTATLISSRWKTDQCKGRNRILFRKCVVFIPRISSLRSYRRARHVSRSMQLRDECHFLHFQAVQIHISLLISKLWFARKFLSPMRYLTYPR